MAFAPLLQKLIAPILDINIYDSRTVNSNNDFLLNRLIGKY